MKKLSSLLVVVSLLLTMFGGISYADTSVTIEGTEIKQPNVSQFLSNLNYSGSEEKTVMKLKEYQLSDRGVDFKGEVVYSDGKESVPFHLNGDLFKSDNQKEGEQSFSGKLTDHQNNFEVMHFFVKNNTAYYKPTINKDLAQSRILQLYLRDKNNNLLAFEQSLDSFSLGSLTGIVEKATPEFDLLWFTKLTKSPIEIETAPKDIVPLSNGSVYQSTNVYSRTTNYAGQVIKENVRGEVWGQIVDVGTSGVSTAYTKLVLAESTYIDGVQHSSTSNFQIHNGAVSVNDMYGKVALGYNTTVNHSKWSGTYTKYGFTGDVSLDFGAGFAGKFLSASLPLSFTYVDSKVEDTNSISYYASNGNYPKTPMMKVKKTDKIYLEDNGDFFNLETTISTIDSSATKNYSTTAKFGWTFGIYYYSESNPVASFTDFGPSKSYKSNVS